MPLLRAIITGAVAAGLLLALVAFGHMLPWHRDAAREPFKSSQQASVLDPGEDVRPEDTPPVDLLSKAEKKATAEKEDGCDRCDHGKEKHHGKRGHGTHDGDPEDRDDDEEWDDED